MRIDQEENSPTLVDLKSYPVDLEILISTMTRSEEK